MGKGHAQLIQPEILSITKEDLQIRLKLIFPQTLLHGSKVSLKDFPKA